MKSVLEHWEENIKGFFHNQLIRDFSINQSVLATSLKYTGRT